jgi:hypothetical protein
MTEESFSLHSRPYLGTFFSKTRVFVWFSCRKVFVIATGIIVLGGLGRDMSSAAVIVGSNTARHLSVCLCCPV